MLELVGTAVALLAAGLLARERLPAPWALALGWAATLGGLLGAVQGSAPLAAPWRFLVGVTALFLGLKVVAHASWRLRGRPALPLAAWVLFVSLWIGMNPAPFAPSARRARRGVGPRVRRGLLGLAAGGAAWALLIVAWRAGAPAWLVHAGQLLGVYGAMRFGAFPLAEGLLRARGVRVGPVWREPERARSLTEFWSRCWNRPFSEMLQLIVERPLRGRVPPTASRVAAFALSGLLHEASVSLPVRAGYGLPSAYFALQALLVALEARTGLPRPLGRLGARGWTLAWAALPAVLVFHPPFLQGVLVPLLGPRA